MKPQSRPYRWLRWFVALAALAFVVHRLASDPEPLRRMLGTGAEVLLGMCALVIVNQALISVRFKVVMEHIGAPSLGLPVWFRVIAIGQMLNLFVPQLGNLYRGVTLKRQYGISYLTYATGLVSFIWLDVIMSMVVALLIILAFEPGLALGGVSALLLLAGGGAAIALGPIVAAALMSRLPLTSGALGKLQQRLTTLLDTTSRAARSPGLMLRVFVLNVLVTAGQTASLWLAFHSVGGAISLSGLVLFQVLIRMSSQVVITPGNLGITELAFGALAHGSQRTLEQGLAVSLLLRAVGSVMVLGLGVISGGVGVLTSGRRGLLERADLPLDTGQGSSATEK